MKPKTVETADGSHSLYLESLDEHYHSIKGAIQESRYVFIEAGLKQKPEEQLRILEIGLGTGLNALLTMQQIESTGQKVHYTSIEKYPLDKAITDQLNYAQITGMDNDLFQNIHNTAWESEQKITDMFYLEKIETDFVGWKPDKTYDLIYFDAFGPDKQPEMWTLAIFEKLFKCTNPGGILTTYSAKGAVRRWMEFAGYEVERIPGPPGKKHMTRATKGNKASQII